MRRIYLLLFAAVLAGAMTACSEPTTQASGDPAAKPAEESEATEMAAFKAEKELTVEIGKTAAEAQKASKHDITEEALKNGQADYMVHASADAAYKISLTESQIQDILGGTTVMVQTAEGGMVVKIAAKEAAKKKGGW